MACSYRSPCIHVLLQQLGVETYLDSRIPPRVQDDDITASSNTQSYQMSVRFVSDIQFDDGSPAPPAFIEINITVQVLSWAMVADAAWLNIGSLDLDREVKWTNTQTNNGRISGLD